MKLISLRVVREERQKKEQENLKRRKKWKQRLLRTSHPHVARREYSCDYCTCPIFAGDEYIQEIYVNAFRFWTKRKHYPNCLGPTEEEDMEIRKELEREQQAERARRDKKSA